MECKNTTERVGSATVRVFLSKLQEMRLDHGILVAADGVTGDEESLRAATRCDPNALPARAGPPRRAHAGGARSPSHTEGLIRLLQDKVSCSQCRHAPSKADDLGHFPSVSTWPVSEMNWLTSPQSSRTGASLSSTARHQIGSRRVVAPGVSESADSRDHGHDD